MLLFPDKFLIRATLVLVAINLIVPGVFGLAPPRWFGHGVLQQTGQVVPTAKIEQLSAETAQVLPPPVSLSGSPNQANAEKPKDRDNFGRYVSLAETESLEKNPVVKSQLSNTGQITALAPPLKVNKASPFKANKRFLEKKLEQPAVRARKDQNEFKFASKSPKISQIKPSQVGRPLLVARIFAKRIPLDHLDLPTLEQKKSFIKITLPLILAANEEIAMRRLAIKRAASAGDRDALEKWARLYQIDVDSKSTHVLKEHILLRADEIPVALALSQAAVESGWGTSRFALQGNALFGQWAWKESAGLKPLKASNDKAVVRSFPNLFGSVRAYMHNLNTHQSYIDMRRERARLAERDERGKGYALAKNLDRYAEIGTEYVDKLRTIIRVNNLDQYATAKLQ